MQKHIGASDTWDGEMRSKVIPLLWRPHRGCRTHSWETGRCLLCWLLCRTEAGGTSEGNLLKTKWFELQRFLQ